MRCDNLYEHIPDSLSDDYKELLHNYILQNKIVTINQLRAAIRYINKFDFDEDKVLDKFPQHLIPEFEKKCGIDIHISKKDIDTEIINIFEKYKSSLDTKKWSMYDQIKKEILKTFEWGDKSLISRRVQKYFTKTYGNRYNIYDRYIDQPSCTITDPIKVKISNYNDKIDKYTDKDKDKDKDKNKDKDKKRDKERLTKKIWINRCDFDPTFQIEKKLHPTKCIKLKNSHIIQCLFYTTIDQKVVEIVCQIVYNYQDLYTDLGEINWLPYCKLK